MTDLAAQTVADRPTRKSTLRRILNNKSVVFGGIIIILLVLLAIFAPALAPMDPLKQDLFARYEAPRGLFIDGSLNTEYVLGGDELGRDLLSRILVGTRVSLIVGLVATGLSLVLGVLLGAIAGYGSRAVDEVIMRIMDVLLAIPGILLAIAIVAALGPSIVNAMMAIAIARVPQMARLIRSEVLALREEEFVEGARAVGVNSVTVLFKHILRNAWAPAWCWRRSAWAQPSSPRHRSASGPGYPAAADQLGPHAVRRQDAIRSAPHVTLYRDWRSPSWCSPSTCWVTACVTCSTPAYATTETQSITAVTDRGSLPLPRFRCCALYFIPAGLRSVWAHDGRSFGAGCDSLPAVMARLLRPGTSPRSGQTGCPTRCDSGTDGDSPDERRILERAQHEPAAGSGSIRRKVHGPGS